MEDFPRIESLRNLTIRRKREWPMNWLDDEPVALRRLTLDARLLPNLVHLDLSGNSLLDENVASIQQLKTLEQIYLTGNNLSVVPDLTGLYNLQVFVIGLENKTHVQTNGLSLRLPNPRAAAPFLKFIVESKQKFDTLKELSGRSVHHEYSKFLVLFN